MQLLSQRLVKHASTDLGLLVVELLVLLAHVVPLRASSSEVNINAQK